MATFFDHLLHDVVTMDEALRRNEEARWTAYLTQVEDLSIDDPIVDPFDDGDDD